MRRLSLRTTILGLLVTAASSVVGVGLGTIMNRTVLARVSAQDGSTIDTPYDFQVPFDQTAPAQGLGGPPGLRVIGLNPQDIPKRKTLSTPRNEVAFGGGPLPIPTWTYNYTASSDKGGATYTGTIVGRSPYLRGKTTTTIPVQIVPLIINIKSGGTTITYDPTVADPCVSSTTSYTDVDVITGSPIFQSTDWVMNGVDVGTTQYHDAFQRAQFWSLVGGSNYHTMLNPTVLPAQTLNFTGSGSSGAGTNYVASSLVPGACGNVGVVNINNLDEAMQSLIAGPLASLVNVGTVPIFLTKNVFMATSGHSIYSNCCVLGYHSAFASGSNIQVYTPFAFDSSGIFGVSNGDVNTLSHELGELINDPSTNNPTPAWGNIGQTSGCQGNFEVGDPLSQGTTNPFVVTGGNGLTYHMQELAFINWFYGGPSLGANGGYSNNGSFTGYAKACPPGGTH